ncbi:3',5'-cyclic AMP phosphodiesterase CpdA [Nocardiopsis mwathae]|uniref:3',5'-cyclic AMP phosphodiesterase CpdA n=1 Tax=Nocardiopsis mwathae TaxID=1472723 RepID=A0A7W9YHF7_9ACTN|nr:metallophosphoesterase [Nocardiopsis mwathae]MBB6171586.1 3',5'-cyclic AMP phosphodiesterase CpdA [Nocardiopsis mwathae]
MFVIAHVSDPHIAATERSRQRFGRVMDHLAALTRPVDAILLTGDVADRGRPEEYTQAAKLVDQPVPVLMCPGNHDDRDAMRESPLLPRADLAFPDRAGAPLHHVRRVGGATFVLLDATVPGEPHGELGEADIDWLYGQLSSERPGTPVLLALHHPPATLGHPGIDDMGLRDPAPLAAVIERFPDVVAVLVGHTHAAVATTFAGRPQVGAVGVNSTLRLPWEVGDGGTGRTDHSAPPGLAFHLLDGDRRLITHFRTLV